MKRAVLALLAGVFAAPAAANEIPMRTFEVILSHEEPELETVGKLRFRGGLDLRSGDSRFGGLSGLDISADGGRITAITDRGIWFNALLSYDRNGRLSGISDTRLQPARGRDGKFFSELRGTLFSNV